jgi:hypothetical protein
MAGNGESDTRRRSGLIPDGVRYALCCEPSDPPGNLVFHSRSLERLFLPARYEAVRLF